MPSRVSFLVVAVCSLCVRNSYAGTEADCKISTQSKGCFEWCTSKTSCATCSPASGTTCAWCESTLTCGPYGGQIADDKYPSGCDSGGQGPCQGNWVMQHGDYKWTCLFNVTRYPFFQQGTVIAHPSQCTADDDIKGASGPKIGAVSPQAGDITKVPTTGEIPIKMVLEFVGQNAHYPKNGADDTTICPGPACNQTIAAGPFNCTKYATNSMKSNVDNANSAVDYTCLELPGIGKGWDMNVVVAGSEKSAFETKPLKRLDPSVNHTMSYQPPTLIGVSTDTAKCSKGSSCIGNSGKNITLTGTNFPAGQGVIDAYQASGTKGPPDLSGFPKTGPGTALVIKIGTTPCDVTYAVSATEAICTVPDASGKDEAVSIAVGGQQTADSSCSLPSPLDKTKCFLFSFNPPKITTPTTPLSGPSYGGKTVSLTGQYFGGVKAVPPTVSFVTATGDRRDCPVTKHTDTTIECTQPASDKQDAVQFTVTVEAGGQQSNQVPFQAQACKDTCLRTQPGTPTCNATGACLCDGNWDRDFAVVDGNAGNLCSCRELVQGKDICKGGSKFVADTCGCTCRGGEQHWKPTPVPAPPGTSLSPPATCSSCSVPCTGTFDSSSPSASGDSCTCSFNGLNVLWMIAVALVLVACCVGGGYLLYKKGGSMARTGNDYQRFDQGKKQAAAVTTSDEEDGRASETYM